MVEEREEREDTETRCGKKENEEKNRGKSSEVGHGSRAKLGSQRRYTLERSKELR